MERGGCGWVRNYVCGERMGELGLGFVACVREREQELACADPRVWVQFKALIIESYWEIIAREWG